MSSSDRSEPVRSCVGCRQRRPQSALVRVTRSDEGIVVDGPSDGRGAWLCRGVTEGDLAAAACVDDALLRRAFARAWRRDVDPADERSIRELVGPRADESTNTRMRIDSSIREAKTTVKG